MNPGQLTLYGIRGKSVDIGIKFDHVGTEQEKFLASDVGNKERHYPQYYLGIETQQKFQRSQNQIALKNSANYKETYEKQIGYCQGKELPPSEAHYLVISESWQSPSYPDEQEE